MEKIVNATENLEEEKPCKHFDVTIYESLEEGERQCVNCGQIVYWGN